ncbi:unnamed protein product [Orchesella dallaii]|uniref:Uncharacterized protein n=1 Tax=Orchesella dallaii TaxID=48710 RepID=A0ABP1Q821_9HEXA
MGAKKRRQESDWQEHDRLPVCTPVDANIDDDAGGDVVCPRKENSNHDLLKCSSCCNNSSINNDNNGTYLVRENDELRQNSTVYSNNHRFPINLGVRCRSTKFCSLLTSNGVVVVVALITFLIASFNVVQVESVCVWQGGGGFKVACGFRQSGLFRLRSIGGIKGYVGAGFTIGDEDGFKDSLTNTEGHPHQPQQGGGYLPTHVHTQRSLPAGQDGQIGQFSHIQEHSMPPLSGDPTVQRQQQIQYLQTIQDQLSVDHENLELKAADQQSQKLLEQQLYAQGMPVPPSPTPTAKVKRAGGLTKRASLWNWPNIFGRGKNKDNGHGKPKKNPKNRAFHGPPHRQHGPPPNRRNGPPPQKHKPGPRFDRPGKNGPPRRQERFQEKQGRRGPGPPKFPPPPNKQQSFMEPMKNPFSHLQENFIGKNSQEMRRMHNIEHEQNNNFNNNFATGQPSFPQQNHPQQHQNQFQHQQHQQPPPFGGNNQQMPPLLMMPPAGPSSEPDFPQFKKIPSNLNKDPSDYDDAPDFQSDQNQFQQQQHTPIDRMMEEPVNDEPPPDYFNNSPESQFRNREDSSDPAGLQMLKRTENFGTIFHLVNPDGSPVNMQFEKQPLLPPNLQFSSQQQQDLAEELMMQNQDIDASGAGLGSMNGGGGGGELENPLATAVYDPNIFPDIYFTTTEKHQHQMQQQNELLNHNMIGSPSPYPLSQEMLDGPQIQENAIKRILGSGSGENRPQSGEKLQQHHQRRLVHRKRVRPHLRSHEQATFDVSTEAPTVIPRRKMRRRKKFRAAQRANNNIVDTSEPEPTGPDGSAMPKRRRKGKRKKYKLQTVKHEEPTMPSSTERMGIPADGGEQASAELKTESPTLDVLTTTPSPEPEITSLLPTAPSSENKIKSAEQDVKRSKVKTKTSFSLPSKEETQSPSSELNAVPSSETKIETTTMTRTSTEETTTKLPFSFSTFGYHDALRGKEKPEDYELYSGQLEGDGEFFYDPRYPPDHEVNRGGHNMTKFIRPRVQGSSTTSTSTVSPFILYDMMGTRNQSRFSSRFDKGTSSFRLDTDDSSAGADTDRVGAPYGQNQHPFYANNNNRQHETNDKGVFLKFDSNEWAGSDQKGHYHKKPDPFSLHYNRTSFNSGYYGGSTEFRPSAELPSSLGAWERQLQTTTTPVPSPVYPKYSSEQISKFSQKSSSAERGRFGPTMETFGPPRTTTTPFAQKVSASGEQGNKQRKLHKNLFGGSSADVSDAGNWASPNFWGTLQDSDRYGASSDFERNTNMKRLMEFGDPNGLKEMPPVDLSSPTPIPMPSPSPAQNTAEDFDNSDYYLSPSALGTRWGKQRRRKGRPTAAPTTPAPAPLIMSTIRPFRASSSTVAPDKWLAVMSNEVDGPAEYYDNIDPNMSLPGSSSGETNLKINAKGKNEKSGIEIKFKSGEERDPEEEAEKNQNEQAKQANTTKPASQHNTNLLGFPTSDERSGFPGVMVNDFDASLGYGFGDGGMKPQPPALAPPSSEINYYPSVSNENRGAHSAVPSGPTGPPSSVLFPPVNNPFGPNNGNNQRPVYPGHNPDQGNRRDFSEPSNEDDITPQNSGLPSHSDNPFKAFEKQTQVNMNGGMGFVSTNHEFREMNDQIQKFSTVPNTFLRRDSSEKLGGHPPNMNGEQHDFPPPPQHQGEEHTNGMDDLPGFVSIPLPEMNPPSGPTENGAQQVHHPAQFAPSGFANDFRDHDLSSGFPPSMPPGMDNQNGLPLAGLKNNMGLNGENQPDIQWDFRPLDDNNVNENIPQYHRPIETTTRHPMLHLDLVNNVNQPGHPGSPPMGPEGNFRGPPMIVDERPPNVRDEPFRPPQGPQRQPPHIHDEHNKLPPRDDRGPPPPPMRNDNHGRPPPRRDEPHIRPPPPPMREDHHGRPPPRRDEPRVRPPPPPLIRDDPRGRPPPPPPREHERPPPPHREHIRPPPPQDHERHPPPPHREHERPPPPPHREHERPPPPPHREHERPPPPPHREHERPPPPPHREHERPPPPPHREHERPPPPPHRERERPPPPPHREHERPPPPPHREHERPPPPPHREHERPPPPGRRVPPQSNLLNPEHNGPPRQLPDDRFRDNPQRRPQPPPARQQENRPKPGPFFYPPTKDDSLRFDKDRKNFLDSRKTIDNLRPPTRSEFPDTGPSQQQGGDRWQEDQGRNPALPRNPPTPHGMPKFLDIQKVAKDQQPKTNAQNPFLQKHQHVKPANIPQQVFKPPPPPPPKQNFFTNLLTGSFGNPNSNHPPPPKSRPQQLPPPPHRPPPNHSQRQPPKSEHMPDPFARIPFRDNHPKDKPNNYINAYNDRYEPPAPHGHENGVNPILPAYPGKESRLPFLPFPPRESFESSFVDLDKDPHAHLLPPKLVPVPDGPPHVDASLPVRTLTNSQNQQAQARPAYEPQKNKEPKDEKHKLLEAFETLNKANYDVIQSLAADQYGPGFIDKLKTKSNMMKPDQASINRPSFPLRVEPLPVITTTTTTPPPKPLFNMFAAFTTKKPMIQDETAKLAELLKMINKQNPVPPPQQLTSASSMATHNNNNDALASLLQSLQKATPPPTTTTTTTTRSPEMPSNPGLVSLTSTFNTASNDIKSLQAQLAKAIIAKAHRKNQPEQLEKPYYQPLQINAATNDSPLAVLQQLAQSRQATVNAANAVTKNYTASQIETLKKLIALNNIEQKLSNNPASNNDPLSKLQALLPAALTSRPPLPSAFPSPNSITNKMLDSSTANSVHGSDPTILALKALALSKAHGVHPQPSISFPQQAKPTESSSGPIAVDLSAILSPSPPVVEMNRRRRLTNVKNAPKSFFPANATQGFEEFSAPLWSEFQCNEQSFFPGLYADTELGCRVFHLCAKTDAGYMMKSFRCPKETVFDQEVHFFLIIKTFQMYSLGLLEKRECRGNGKSIINNILFFRYSGATGTSS